MSLCLYLVLPFKTEIWRKRCSTEDLRCQSKLMSIEQPWEILFPMNNYNCFNDGEATFMLIFVKVTALNLAKWQVHPSDYPHQNEIEWTVRSPAVFSKTNWNIRHASKVAELREFMFITHIFPRAWQDVRLAYTYKRTMTKKCNMDFNILRKISITDYARF